MFRHFLAVVVHVQTFFGCSSTCSDIFWLHEDKNFLVVVVHVQTFLVVVVHVQTFFGCCSTCTDIFWLHEDKNFWLLLDNDFLVAGLQE